MDEVLFCILLQILLAKSKGLRLIVRLIAVL